MDACLQSGSRVGVIGIWAWMAYEIQAAHARHTRAEGALGSFLHAGMWVFGSGLMIM